MFQILIVKDDSITLQPFVGSQQSSIIPLTIEDMFTPYGIIIPLTAHYTILHNLLEHKALLDNRKDVFFTGVYIDSIGKIFSIFLCLDKTGKNIDDLQLKYRVQYNTGTICMTNFIECEQATIALMKLTDNDVNKTFEYLKQIIILPDIKPITIGIKDLLKRFEDYKERVKDDPIRQFRMPLEEALKPFFPTIRTYNQNKIKHIS